MTNSTLEDGNVAAFTLQKEILLADWASGKTAIRDLDAATFKIKGWAITVFGGTLAASVALKLPSLLLFSVISSLLFWALDALFKSFQHRFILRDVEIGRYLSSSDLLEDQVAGRIRSVAIARPFYDMQRLADDDENAIPRWLLTVSERCMIKTASLVDLVSAMRLANVKALYYSLIGLAVLLWLGFLTVMSAT